MYNEQYAVPVVCCKMSVLREKKLCSLHCTYIVQYNNNNSGQDTLRRQAKSTHRIRKANSHNTKIQSKVSIPLLWQNLAILTMTWSYVTG